MVGGRIAGWGMLSGPQTLDHHGFLLEPLKEPLKEPFSY